MRRGEWAGDPEQLRAASQDGVIRARDLMALGVPESTIYRRVRANGPWTSLGPGVVLLGNGPPTQDQLDRAALLHGGPSAMLTAAAAARRHGMRRGPDPESSHILIPAAARAMNVKHIIAERTIRLPTAQDKGGFAVAPLARSLLDGTRRMTNHTDVSAILTEPVQRGLLEPQQLLDELDAGCRKGSNVARSVLAAVGARVRSPSEYEVREWWTAQPGLPPAQWNVDVLDESGLFIANVDLLVAETGFGMEVDSVEHHFLNGAQIERDAVRRRRLRGVGLHIMSVRPSQLHRDEAGLLRDVLHELSLAALLPPPRATFRIPERR